ncbi:MAG TPA: SpoIIE family protein phosphatase, partial [Candidatus Krumholzibacteriaceae bacterium]|nr:SpoIIE family protein phosphatase [Candidatus Krumholzibacteriaceae bacterium]
KKFKHYKSRANDPNSLSHDIVWSILEDDSGILWIGTHGGGLDRLDRENNRVEHFRHDPDDPASLSHDIVRVIFRDSGGVLWVGTNGGGICRMMSGKGRFKIYRNIPGEISSLSHDEIRSIYEDSEGTMWVGTNGGGLNRFNRDTGEFKRYRYDPDDPGGISNDYIRVIYEDSAGNFWLGTQGGGLNRFDRETGRAVTYMIDRNRENSINSNYVFSIHEDRSGILWLATWGGGLNRFDPETGIFKAYTVEDGLSSNSIYGVLEDGDNNLWMSTNNGISCFNPGTGEFKNYNERDGLQSDEFNGGSYFISDSGEMFFGGIRGFNAFYPELIEDNLYKPRVVITSFKKLNKEVRLEDYISEADHITLSYKDYSFSFEFAALEYSAPEKNMYAYKMEGLSEYWTYTDYRKRFANFTTLSPGEYRFRVKGSNNDGIWNNKGVSLAITITPPFWRRRSFRAVVIVLLAGLGVIWYRRRVQNVRMKTELETAHRVQMSIMPQTSPEVVGFDISGICIPAYEVGGDFFDYIWLGKDRSKLGVVVGDVSGKAMQAAMIAVLSSGMVNAALNDRDSVKGLITQLNRAIYDKTGEMIFTALCFCSIYIKAREVVFTCGGMKSPLLKSGGGVSVLHGKGCGLPLGALPDSRYDEERVKLVSGDVMVLFSDGVTDARGHKGDFYGDERLKELIGLLDTSDLSSREIRDIILKDINRFTENNRQEDDITIVIIKAE